MRYFAYGTNVNPLVLARKRLPVRSYLAASLADHALRFNKRNLRRTLPEPIGFANIVARPGARVFGVVYSIEDAMLPRLDALEHCPEHYRRVVVRVDADEGVFDALTYRASSAVTTEGLLPSRNYLNHMLDAGELLPEGYRRRLRRRVAFIGECAACHEGAEVVFHRQARELFGLCPPCLEARQVWSDALQRELSVLEIEAVVTHLHRRGAGYPSVLALLDDAAALGLVDPPNEEADR